MRTIRRLAGSVRSWLVRAGDRRRAIAERRAATISRDPGAGTPPTGGWH